MQTRRLAVSFEPLTGSVALTRPEKVPRKVMWDPVALAREFPILVGHGSVKSFLLFYACNLYFCRSWTSGSCVTI